MTTNDDGSGYGDGTSYGDGTGYGDGYGSGSGYGSGYGSGDSGYGYNNRNKSTQADILLCIDIDDLRDLIVNHLVRML